MTALLILIQASLQPFFSFYPNSNSYSRSHSHSRSHPHPHYRPNSNPHLYPHSHSHSNPHPCSHSPSPLPTIHNDIHTPIPLYQEAMRSRQIAERLGVEKAHMLEFQQFTMVWDRKMNEYDMNAHELIEVCMFASYIPPLTSPLPSLLSTLLYSTLINPFHSSLLHSHYSTLLSTPHFLTSLSSLLPSLRYSQAMKDRHISELLQHHNQLLEKQPRPKYSTDLLNLRKIEETLAKQKE